MINFIENVSLAITARNEYTAFIKNNPGGVDALIANLKGKILNKKASRRLPILEVKKFVLLSEDETAEVFKFGVP